MSGLFRSGRPPEEPDDERLEESSAAGLGRRLVARTVTLRGFIEEVSRRRGLSLADLQPISLLSVQTANSVYRITVLQPEELRILVQGGVFFPEATKAYLEGSSLGGSFLRRGWLGPGLRMEILAPAGRIVTSRIESLEVRADTSLPGPF